MERSLFGAKSVSVVVVLSVLIGLLYVSQFYRTQSNCDQVQTSSELQTELGPERPAGPKLGPELNPKPGPELNPEPGAELNPEPGAELNPEPGAELNPEPGPERPATPELHMPHRLEYQQPSITRGRTDVVTVTPWLAPVIWESTFDPVLLDAIFKPKNLTIAATVFAVGKYVQFLKDFLETSEQFFFIGFNVHIYVFTDRPQDVPEVQMAPGRQVLVREVPSSRRWQEISARRMEMVHALLLELRRSTHYVFCLDVDSKFHGRWSSESLSETVAVVHPGYYGDPRNRFPYERRPQSRAYMAPSDGDFYYCGGAFGGSVDRVLDLTRICSKNYRDDEKEGVEAAWQEESHLNRYFWENKPSKVLSPEYLWQDFKDRNPEIQIIRFSGVIKNYAAIRPNV